MLTRSRILRAAMEEFAAKGLEARVEDIAEMAGANRRMAYYYFGSKEGLYLAALEETFLELTTVEKAIDIDSQAPMDALAAFVSAKFDHFVKYPRYVQFLKIENLYQGRHIRQSSRLRELRGPLLDQIEKVLKAGQSSGIMRKDIDAFDLYVSISALGYFTFSNKHTLGAVFGVDLTTPKAIEDRRRNIIDMVTTYVRAHADEPPATKQEAAAKAGTGSARKKRA